MGPGLKALIYDVLGLGLIAIVYGVPQLTPADKHGEGYQGSLLLGLSVLSAICLNHALSNPKVEVSGLEWV